MKCTTCQQQIKPVLAVDIDGTVAEYHTALMMFLIRYFDFHESSIPSMMAENGLCSWDGFGDWEDWLELDRKEYEEGKLAFRQGGNKRWMQVFVGAPELIRGAHALGCEVYFTTTRPYMRLDNTDPDTREWLNRNNFQYEGLLYHEDKYAKLIDIVGKERIVGVIDDLPEQIDRAVELGLPAFQPERNHNAHLSQRRTPRGSLVQALQWVRNKVGERNEQEAQEDRRQGRLWDVT